MGGRGVLLGGVPGVPAAKVVVIGVGVAGTNALEMAHGLRAQVTAIDNSVPRLRQVDALFHGSVRTVYSTADAIEQAIAEADLVIGAVLVPGAAAPKLVTAAMVRRMQPGAVMVDDGRVSLPPKNEVYNSIEGMINHFKIIMDGIRVPAGEAYTFVEGGNGELGFFIVADGTGRPYKAYVRSPSFVHLSTAGQLMHDHLIADVVPIFGMINMIGGECDK